MKVWGNTPRWRNGLIAVIGTLHACAPMSMMQEAHLVPKGQDKIGMGGIAMVPLEPETRWQPDGDLTPQASASQPDLQYYPIPSMIGWIRRGTGWGETQAAVSMPGLIITLASKLGVFGKEPGSAASMSLSAEMNFAPITGSVTFGSSLFFSMQVSGGVSLDLSTRVGNYPGIWLGLGVAPTLGVTLPLANGANLHLGAGANFPTGEGPSPLSAWLYAGATLP
jgi:hypothetical protein